jgi:hypothetical protein
MAVQTIVSTGATDYTIQNQFSSQPIIMTVDNVTQVETVDFTRYGTILTFTSPPAPGLVIAIQDVAGVTGSPLSSFIAVDGGTVIGGGGGTSGISADFAMHAFNRDADGLLTYTKVLWDSDEPVELANGEGIFVNGLEQLLDNRLDDGTPMNSVQEGYVEPNREQWQTQSVHRKYEQTRFDNNKLFYFINSRGYLVARYNRDYTHTGPA